MSQVTGLLTGRRARGYARACAGLLAAMAGASWALWAVQANAQPDPGALSPLSWAIDGGGTVSVQAPQGATALEADALPRVDASGVTGLKEVLKKGVARAQATSPEHSNDLLYAVCVKVPSAQLGPGSELLVLDKLNDAAKKEIGKSARLDQLVEGNPVDVGHTTRQTFTADAAPTTPSKHRYRVEGLHVVGYVGEVADMLICSVACAEQSSEAARICPKVMATAQVSAAFVAPPRPGIATRLGQAMLRKPAPAAGLLGGSLLALLGLLLAAIPPRRQQG